jgi:mono/diheme cytochrome c family protein
LLPRRGFAATAVLLVAFLAAGCGAVGRVTKGDAGQGKKLFSDKCASCHTLADAKAQGTIGPNLDDAFSSDKQQGFSEQTMRDVVRGQIAYPEKPMPSNLVRGTDADDVATYIAKCAGNPNCGITAANPAPPPSSGGSGGTQTNVSGGGNQPDGKQVFTSAGCAGCHTLKDAAASGNVGPNLDALKPPKDVVAHQVEVGGGAMPAFKGQLSAAQIQAVAAYVAKVAGK